MVHFSSFLLRIKPAELGKHMGRSFIDRLRIFVKSGKGGRGFGRMGGIGGDGGSIFIVGKNECTLKSVYSANLRKRYIAGNGQNSKKLKLFGANGQDIRIPVPCGVTAVLDSGLIIGEVNDDGEELLIAKGGKGSKRETIGDGQEFSVNLDLKLIADIGLIGFPNAGKSTLLSLISRAQPKIANYPFTTLTPQLGVIEFEDSRSISIADLPGLVEGAHENRGMGHKFLKHISRTKVNLFIVDIDGFQLNYKFHKRSAFETVVFLNKELEMYDASLVTKPSILVINKMDTENAQEKLDEFLGQYEDYENSLKNIEPDWIPEKRIDFSQVFEISAKTNLNVQELCLELRELIDKLDERRGPSKDRDQASDDRQQKYIELV